MSLQEAFPGRFKGFHILNQPWYISVIMAIIRPFLKQKFRERVCMIYSLSTAVFYSSALFSELLLLAKQEKGLVYSKISHNHIVCGKCFVTLNAW